MFKENVSDIRNSKVADVVRELKAFSLNVDVTDPLCRQRGTETRILFELAAKPVRRRRRDP